MTELDADETRILRNARQGLTPSAKDRARIAHALLPRLALPMTPPSVSRVEGRALHAARWAGLAGVVALTGAVGYWQGYRAGAQVREVVTVVRSVPSAPPTTALTAPPPPALADQPLAIPSAGPASSLRSAASRPSSGMAVEGSEARRALGLDDEVRELRRVEKAIREQNPRLALVLLDQLDQTIPAGQLLEERAAARVMGNCSLGAPSGPSDARAFVAKHPQSAYVARVTEICRPASAVNERISPAPGTSVQGREIRK